MLKADPPGSDVSFLCCSHHTTCREGGKELAIPGGIHRGSNWHLYPDSTGS